MKTKKPTLEKINLDFDSSFLVKRHQKFLKNNRAVWHFHPEIELVYVNSGKGKRHIGNHLSYFNNSQLLLIGANLPHHGFTDRLTTATGSETLIQFKEEFLGNQFFDIPEMKKIKKLFERSKKGLLFGRATKDKLGEKIEKLPEKKGFKRVLVFLEILHHLAKTEDYTILNVDGYAFETTAQDSQRIDLIYNYISNHFKEQISLKTIAEVASMTVPAFCRYFKRVTGKTFTKLVNEYRVVHATKLLTESQLTISEVAFECGFNNFSHFNKTFNEVTGKTASEYRKETKLILI